MGDITPLEQSEDKSVDLDSNRELSERINRWVNERPMVKLWAEWNARRQIAQEIQKDIKTKGAYTKPTPDVIAQMARIVDVNRSPVPRSDSLTGEAFFHILRRESDDLIAEERTTPDISSDTNLISQARIGPEGQTELTLSFTGERFKARDANPNIIHSANYPNTALKVFDTLTKAVQEAHKSIGS